MNDDKLPQYYLKCLDLIKTWNDTESDELWQSLVSGADLVFRQRKCEDVKESKIWKS